MRSLLKLNYKVLDTVKSTNDFLKEKARSESVKNGEFVLANFQDNGRGQQEKKWESESGKNLLFTIVLQQVSIDLVSFNRAVSLCLMNFIQQVLNNTAHNTVHKVAIKWPNDILVNGQKIAGVLIENMLQGTDVKYSFVGIGLNVNQQRFPIFDRKACSIFQFLQQELNVENLSKNLAEQLIENPYMKWSKGQLQDAYNENLYLYQKESLFFANDQKLHLTIMGSNEDGQLVLLGEKGQSFKFNNGELKYLD